MQRFSTQSEQNVVGRSTTIVGRILGDGPLTVLGGVEGGVDVSGAVVVEAEASVSGELQAERVTLRGQFDGTGAISDLLRIEDGGSASGDVTAARLELTAGARLLATITIDAAAPTGAATKG